MIQVSSKTYRIFFEELKSKLVYELYTSKGLGKPKDFWNDTFKDDEGKQIPFTEHLFSARPKYFVGRNTEANKGATVSLKALPFAKALDFLKEEPASFQYSSNWDALAQQLLDDFTKRHNIETDKPKEKISPQPFMGVTAIGEVWEFRNAMEEFRRFINCIHANNYADAWRMLSSSFKRYWNASYDNFKNSFIVKTPIPSTIYFDHYSFSYAYKKILFNVEYSEDRLLLDFSSKRETLIKTKYLLDNNHTTSVLMHPNFQEFIASKGLLNKEKLAVYKKYKESSRTKVVAFIFSESIWQIDHISNFAPRFLNRGETEFLPEAPYDYYPFARPNYLDELI